MFRFPSRFFVTGTDTMVGKTFVSAVLALGLEAYYWKPVQSGRDPMTDREWLHEVAGLPEERLLEERYCLTEPLSPHASAAIDGVRIELSDFILPAKAPLIVEGAGGVLVPINGQDTMLDLMKRFGLPVLVVARSALGTINHTCLTVRQLQSAGLMVLGVVMNGLRNSLNKEAIEHFARVPVLAEIEPVANANADTLVAVFRDKFYACTQAMVLS